MKTGFFISHPEIVVDATRPVPRWQLSNKGIDRMRRFVASPVLQNVTAVWASDETKAIEAAGFMAARFGLPVQVDPALHENDRSATGFLPPEEFEKVATEFFNRPTESVRGWECAIDAQERVSSAVDRILEAHSGEDIAFVAHGGVGTLLLCQMLDVPISRTYDQPFQGHYWSFNTETREVLHSWEPIADR